MALVIVASALPMAVLCTSTPEPGLDAAYSVELVGERDLSAINGVGLTYDVDDVAFNEWIALNTDLAASVRIVTQAEIDAWADTADQYGYELGLVQEGGTLAAGGLGKIGLGTIDLVGDAERLRTAALRHRTAEQQLRQAELTRDQAEANLEAARAEREVAETMAREASEEAAKSQEAVRQPPPERRADDPQPHAEA